MLAVNPRLPIKSVADLIALAKKEPGRLIGASSGNGATSHMSLGEFEKMAGVEDHPRALPGRSAEPDRSHFRRSPARVR